MEESRTGRVTNQQLQQAWQAFLREFGDPFGGTSACPHGPEALVSLIREIAASPLQVERWAPAAVESLQDLFLSSFSGPKRAEMVEYLDLTRASYRLRDDDNLHL